MTGPNLSTGPIKDEARELGSGAGLRGQKSTNTNSVQRAPRVHKVPPQTFSAPLDAGLADRLMAECPTLKRWGFVLTTEVQGAPERNLHLVIPGGTVVRMSASRGKAARALRRLEILASHGNRTVIQRWVSKKLRAKRFGGATREHYVGREQ